MPARRHDQDQPADALTMLQADHQRVKDLFAHYEATADRARKRALAEHVFVELETHAQVEESVFYPAVNEETGEGPEHELIQNVAHHVEEEEAQMFPSQSSPLLPLRVCGINATVLKGIRIVHQCLKPFVFQ